MNEFPWLTFVVLWLAGTAAAVLVLPYAFSLQQERLAGAPLSLRQLALISAVQSSIFIAIATGVGLLAAGRTGLGLPVITGLLYEGADLSTVIALLPLSLLVGAAAGALVVLLDRLMNPYLPAGLTQVSAQPPLWQRVIAAFYGGIAEELMFRLGLTSVLALIIGLVWQNESGLPADGAFVLAIVGAALLFGVGHLPATRALAPLTPLVILRALLLNGVAGVAFGFLFWQHGLLAAMLAHWAADIMLHVIAAELLRRFAPQAQAPHTPSGPVSTAN